MHFQYPLILGLLLLVPPLVAYALWRSYKRRDSWREAYGDEDLVGGSSKPSSKRMRIARTAVIAVGLSGLIVALSRPAIDSGTVEFPQGTTDVIVLVDVSRSMAALDYKSKMPSGTPFNHGTRLDMARHLVRYQIVPSLGANRLGLVTFAGEPFPLAFLTQDVSAVDWVHRRAVTISSAPGEGSHVAKAFQLAFRLFDLDSDPHHRKVIVLMSDGGNDDGLDELNKTIEELKARGIDLVVVGLGRPTPSPIPVAELSPADQRRFSGQEFYMDKGEIAQSSLDENVLRLFSNRSGGRYMRITQADDFSFESIANRLEMKYRRGQQELFFYPLIFGGLCLAAGWLLGEEIWRKRSQPAEGTD